MTEQQHDPMQQIKAGRCYAIIAYDVGASIDIDDCERRISALKQREKIRHKRRAPTYFEYRPLPLRVTQQIEPFTISGFRSDAIVDAVLYDFGAVSVIYSFLIRGPIENLLPLSDALYDNQRLLEDSRKRVQELVSAVGPAISKPIISEVVEDYVMYEIQSTGMEDIPEGFINRNRALLAQILRSENQALSPQEIGDALSYRLSFSPKDLTIIDWNAAFLYGEGDEDVRAVLEFANVELLEMRYLDQQLDDALDEAYRGLSGRRSWIRLLFSRESELDRVAQMQVDNALLFEGVNNSLKLLGDQYLARVYNSAARRFHMAEWDSSILRKLQTLESIYQKMSDRRSITRMEVLEWIIIILIFVSIILPFVLNVSY